MELRSGKILKHVSVPKNGKATNRANLEPKIHQTRSRVRVDANVVHTASNSSISGLKRKRRTTKQDQIELRAQGEPTRKSKRQRTPRKVQPESPVSQGTTVRSIAQEKALVRDKICRMLKKAGWEFQYIPRKERSCYKDQVYVDRKGRRYWSITKAYYKLLKSIEDRSADKKEISAFTQIPQNEISKLFRVVRKTTEKSKEHGNDESNSIVDEEDSLTDDSCNICGDGGEVVCCDGCPSTFHQHCLEIQNFPSGKWYCLYCLCKYCGTIAVNASRARRGHGANTTNSEISSCLLCEDKFHESCALKAPEANAMSTNSSSLSFCGMKCREIYEGLQKLLGLKIKLKQGFSYTLLRHFDLSQDSKSRGTWLKIQCNTKLDVAFSAMDECFVPIVDTLTGVNTINHIVYNRGSEIRRLNYTGFFTIILEMEDDVIAVASIRIHGSKLAEMPFIGTREMYRRQGMCRRLVDSIESILSFLGVEELVIPAIPDLYQTWTKKFGFQPLEDSTRVLMKSMSMVVFPGTQMLQKHIPENHSGVHILQRRVSGLGFWLSCNLRIS